MTEESSTVKGSPASRALGADGNVLVSNQPFDNINVAIECRCITSECQREKNIPRYVKKKKER